MPPESHTPPEQARDILSRHAIDMIISDLDGTLLSPASQISPRTRAAVKAILEAGIRFTLASGRPKMSVIDIMQELAFEDTYIAGGGAYVEDPSQNLVIEHQVFDRDTIEKIAFLARQCGASLLFEEPERMYLESTDEISRLFNEMAGFPIPRVDDVLAEATTLPTKIVLVAEAEVLSALDPSLEAMHDRLSMASSYPTLRDVTPAGMNKGSALEKLSRHVGIPGERILAIGDGWNDKSMFDVAAVGVAVANATPNVLAEADIIAPSNEDDGVAWVLEQVLAVHTARSLPAPRR